MLAYFLLAAALEWPSWLTLPGNVTAQSNTSPGLIEKSYQVAGKPDAAVEHFRGIFTGAKLAFSPTADGIGLAARVAAPECDLLLQFHPSSGSTTVRIHCAARNQATNEFYIPPVSSSRVPRAAVPDASQLSQRSRARMERFDTPQQASSISLYNNDAPPLEWPVWLVRMDSGAAIRPTATRADGKDCLKADYTTAALPMTKLVYGHEDLFEANGFRVPNMKLETGHTLSGKIVQNKSGRVEGTLSQNGRVNGPATKIDASFSRSVVNGPITVYLRVCVQGSYGWR
jgi:hypothetical protein